VPLMTTRQGARQSADAGVPKSEPFQSYLDVPVAGGSLTVALAGAPPEPGGTVVLCLHGMTGTHMVYRTVAREFRKMAPSASLLAPDLRGRGRSAGLPGPYGMAAHVADLLAVLDHVGADRAILVGHSMGCNIAARFGADHPERTAAVVLLDGGLPIVTDKVGDADEDEDEPPGIFDRFETKYATVEEYLAYWRSHPALAAAWDEDVDAFVARDYVVDENGVRCVAQQKAVLTDVEDLMLDGVTWKAITRSRAPVRLMRAERGLYDDDPIIPIPELHEFLKENPQVTVDMVADVNHFTMVIGGGHGPPRVAATLAELAAGGLRG
jgi:lipase